MNQKTKRRKMMSKNEIEDIKKIIKEYLKDNLRLEARSRYLDEYSQADNYIDVYLGDEKIQEVPLYELDFFRR